MTPVTSGIQMANFLLGKRRRFAVRDARRVSEREVKAYVFPFTPGTVGGLMLSPPSRARANITGFKNSGQTPAYKVRELGKHTGSYP
jgi:hypothetical protein